MVNFLTEEFFWQEKIKKFVFTSLIILLAVLAFVSNYLLTLYLENKELVLQTELIEQRVELIDERASEIDEFKSEKQDLEQQLHHKQEQVAENLSLKLLMQELAQLNFAELYLTEFELYDEYFELTGLTADSMYLSQSINQLEEQSFFKSYHLEDITEEQDWIKFNIRGEVRKELEND